MKKIIGLLLISQSVFSQHQFIAQIKNEETRKPLENVTVSILSIHKNAISSENGIVFMGNIPPGKYEFAISCVGFKSQEREIVLPLKGVDTIKIFLDPSTEVLQDVIVSSTRFNQLVKNSPIHIDVIDKEDIEEGIAASPGNIRELLTELSGTQIQQTSAVSGNVNIRLQGLDGRYTQLLKDGFPLYGGFSGSLNILQTPPLDLKQVEIIKGGGSALYGGDAIGGIINLISIVPDSVNHVQAIFNQTFKGGTDLSSFYSGGKDKLRFTFLTSISRQIPYDVNKDGFTDLPKLGQFTVLPALFWYPDDSTVLRFGVNYTLENRTGGDISAIKNGVDSLHSFIEKNHSDRSYYQFSLVRKMKSHATFTIKNSIGYFYRSIEETDQLFYGTQLSSFTEASLSFKSQTHQNIAGTDLITDKFLPGANNNNPQSLKYDNTTIGVFAQDDWKLNNKTTLETGIRTDFHEQVYVLPRLALMYKILPRVTSRIGAGLGYKLPTVFNAASEEDSYQKVYPIGSTVKAERSASANVAFNERFNIDEIDVQIDQNFYVTQLSDALVPNSDSLLSGWLYYINAPGSTVSKGFETNAKLSIEDFSLNLSYTYTDATANYLAGKPQLPLTPKNRFVTTVLYEMEGFRIGMDVFYTGSQFLYDGTKTKDFWTLDLMTEKSFGHFSILFNVENLTDFRQSKFGPLYTGPVQDPVFKPVYAPLDGIVANIALRLKL